MDNIKKVIVKTLAGQEEYALEDSEIREDVQQIIEGAPEELDSFKEAFEAFKEGSQALQANAEAIATEKARAQGAEKANAEAITAEKARAQGAEKANAEAITAEVKRATDAEKVNAEAITAEVKRATEAEKANAEAITAEVKRATDAEKVNADAIAALTSGGTFRALYIAAGAEYNDSGVDKTKTAPWGEPVTHKAGRYYLNGLGDITEEQMMIIYNAPHNAFSEQAYASSRNVRTVFFSAGSPTVGLTSSPNAIFIGCYELETIVGKGVLYFAPSSGTVKNLFRGCSKLKHICLTAFYGRYVKIEDTVFKGCTSLVTVKLDQLEQSISFADCSLISQQSVLHTINNAKPSAAITITLHPDAYVRLADDADIVAALSAQPLVTLVSA